MKLLNKQMILNLNYYNNIVFMNLRRLHEAIECLADCNEMDLLLLAYRIDFLGTCLKKYRQENPKEETLDFILKHIKLILS